MTLSLLVFIYTINTPSGATITADPANWPEALRGYLENVAGPYSSAAGFVAYEKVPDSLRANLSSRTTDALDSFPSDWPELEYIVGSITASLAKPLSNGNVTISSDSMPDQPVIDLGWLTDPGDAEVAVAGVKRVEGCGYFRISTFHIAIPTHPQATVYMLAEKIADDIKNGR